MSVRCIRRDSDKDVHDDETPLGVILEQFFQSLYMETTVTHVHRADHQSSDVGSMKDSRVDGLERLERE
jgi:hypothetical protein